MDDREPHEPVHVAPYIVNDECGTNDDILFVLTFIGLLVLLVFGTICLMGDCA